MNQIMPSHRLEKRTILGLTLTCKLNTTSQTMPVGKTLIIDHKPYMYLQESSQATLYKHLCPGSLGDAPCETGTKHQHYFPGANRM